MTQFLYVSGPSPDLSAFPGVSAKPAVAIGVRGVEALLPPEALLRTWELVAEEEDSEVADEWTGDAIEEVLVQGRSFQGTKLGRFLTGYLRVAERITLSHAEDSVDEATFSEERQFLRSVEAQLRSSCDVNARFVRRGAVGALRAR